MIFRILYFLPLIICSQIRAQSGEVDTDAFLIKSVYETALRDGQCYQWLAQMSTTIGHRLSGSPEAEQAVQFTKEIMDTLGLDSVWLQPCRVRPWLRGEKEVVKVVPSRGASINLHALALGNSVGTGPSGLTAPVVEILDLDVLRNMSPEAVKGKIVFFNRPMDPTIVNPFQAYGNAVDQRWAGPILAAEKGAVAAIVRSMTHALDTFAHTGSTDYQESMHNIPAVAISTIDAERLSAMLKETALQLYVRTTCAWADSVMSYNVIGEIKGSEHPEQIILVGGHLDSWDVGHGAHDDGTGCMQSLEVLRLLKRVGYIPRRTIRCVLFMNEENGLRGGRVYADSSNANGEFHLAAIEADGGGFRPTGFGCSSQSGLQEKYLAAMTPWWNLLEPYDLELFPGGGGADIGPLRSQGGMLIGMRVDAQRYFDYHHTHADTLDKVHPRELQLGAAAMTALVILLDKFAKPLQ